MAWVPAPLRPLRAHVAVLVAATVFQFAPAVRAAGKIAALVPQIHPNSSPELQSRFHESVTRGLAGTDAEVIPTGEVRLRIGVSDELLTCSGPGICAARAATALHADRLVATDVNNVGKDYTIHMLMLDAAGREVARTDEPCDICTAKEADEAVQRAAARLLVTARTNPTAIAQQPAPPPRPVEPPPSEPQPPPSATPPEPVPPAATIAPAPVERKGFPWRAVAISSLVVGVVGIVAGAPLLAIDGQPTCSLPDPKHSCKNVYDTAGGGAALVTIGVAGIAAAAVLFYVDYRTRHRAARLTVAPITGGAMLSTSMRF